MGVMREVQSSNFLPKKQGSVSMVRIIPWIAICLQNPRSITQTPTNIFTVTKEMIGNLIIPDIFLSSIDLDILTILPDIANSPYINLDPAMRVIYYNALYYGLSILHGPGTAPSLAAYYKVLEAVPAWLNGTDGTDLDGHTAALTVSMQSSPDQDRIADAVIDRPGRR